MMSRQRLVMISLQVCGSSAEDPPCCSSSSFDDQVSALGFEL
jgi:hypothetical protein